MCDPVIMYNVQLIKYGYYLELVPIHVGLKGQLYLAQGNALGVRIPPLFRRPDRAAT